MVNALSGLFATATAVVTELLINIRRKISRPCHGGAYFFVFLVIQVTIIKIAARINENNSKTVNGITIMAVLLSEAQPKHCPQQLLVGILHSISFHVKIWPFLRFQHLLFHTTHQNTHKRLQNREKHSPTPCHYATIAIITIQEN